MRKILGYVVIFTLISLSGSLFAQDGIYLEAGKPVGGNTIGTYDEGYKLGLSSSDSSVWWGVSSVVSGCCVGGMMPVSLGWGVPLVSAGAGSIPILVASMGDPSPNPVLLIMMEHKGPEYTKGFKAGYSKSKKDKNITAATWGMVISVALAVATIKLIEAQPKDDRQ